MTFLLALVVLGVIGTLVIAAFKRNLVLEQTVLVVAGVVLLLAIAFGWGHYGEVHGGAIWLLLLSMMALAIIVVELLLLVFLRSRQRLAQVAIVMTTYAGMIVAAWAYG